MDERIKTLAKNLINYSVAAKKATRCSSKRSRPVPTS